eukprot:TRINITY_DN3371_c0_g1_i1.p1 TRINITY_DN3371_c0_g1~~TRINITY_DN3371_c0_g1_i1.p1  ORF type:complete len:298 (+),score=125.38 TRINITY_DN3371_c0_g1_i1:54-896(+)
MEPKLAELLEMPKEDRAEALAQVNEELEKMTASERVRWSLENLEGEFTVSSSFGIQSAVMLHLCTTVRPDMPVTLTDTGYLFPETYAFIDELTRTLKLNMKVYRAKESAAWQEARYGKLWEQGAEGIGQYNEINKTEPMARALKELKIGTWFAGLRRGQSSTRSARPVLSIDKTGVFKVLPIIDWSDEDVDKYLADNKLPYHPLKYEGYVSMGDWHTTSKLLPGMRVEDTRFHGLKRECGLHDDSDGGVKSKKIGRCRLTDDPQLKHFAPFRVNFRAARN